MPPSKGGFIEIDFLDKESGYEPVCSLLLIIYSVCTNLYQSVEFFFIANIPAEDMVKGSCLSYIRPALLSSFFGMTVKTREE